MSDTRPGPSRTRLRRPHHRGGAPVELPPSVTDWWWYRDGEQQPAEDLAAAAGRARDGEGFVWLALHDPDVEAMTAFAEEFGLHPLAIEDAVEGHTRSKLERFRGHDDTAGDTLFAVASMVRYVDAAGAGVEQRGAGELRRNGQLMVVLGEHFVMTVRRGGSGSLGDLRERLEAADGTLLRRLGPSAVLYAVLDSVMETYLAVVAAIEEDVDEVEEDVFAPHSGNDVDRVYRLKREVIEFRRAVGPLGPALLALTSREELPLPAASRPYFRELLDHHTEAKESVTSFDDVLTSILAFAQTRASNDDNADMRRLSAWVAMVALPTLVAGLFGMNFSYLPGMDYRYGFVVCVAAMALSVGVLFVTFKRKGWL